MIGMGELLLPNTMTFKIKNLITGLSGRNSKSSNISLDNPRLSELKPKGMQDSHNNFLSLSIPL